MKYAADFRSIARNALSGRWTVAVIAGLIASLLGAVATNGPQIKLNISDSGINLGLEVAGRQIYTTGNGWSGPFANFLATGFSFFAAAAVVIAVAYFILSSVIHIGYAKFNLDLIDREEDPQTSALFAYFRYWKTAAATNLLQGLYVFLWSLLFVIPGIMASYSYAMTGYILAQNPELTASEAIEQSKAMMYGNRFRLFCLQMSFLGWSILSTLTFGIGNLWLTPYRQASEAAFYREVSGAVQNTGWDA